MMNEKIKAILEKHLVINDNTPSFELQAINEAIIEICEEQMLETAKMIRKMVEFAYENGNIDITPTPKNIAK